MSKIPDDPDQVVDYNPLDNTSKSILPFFNFEIASTPNCNMACTYCFEGDELKSKAKQKQENIPKIVQKIKELLTSESFTKEYSGIVLNFWGGEPTINFNWNKDLITAIRQERINGKPLNVRYFIYTNGYSYTKVTQHLDLFTKQEIKDQIIRIQISWDGIEGLRVDHSGKQTLNIIRENIKKIAKNYPDLNASTKATIQPDELLKLSRIWEEFYKLYLEITGYNSKFKISFSPTLNYIDDYEITEEYLFKIKEEFKKTAQLELQFFSKFQDSLFSWFGGNNHSDLLNKRSTNCSAGINIIAMDLDGNVSPCHGTLYSPLKQDFIEFSDTNWNDINFVEKVQIQRFKLKPELNRMDDACKNCEATVCYKCPIVNIEQVAQETKEIKDHEDHEKTIFKRTSPDDIVKNFQKRDPRHCGIYKTFGPIDRAFVNMKLTLIKNKF